MVYGECSGQVLGLSFYEFNAVYASGRIASLWRGIVEVSSQEWFMENIMDEQLARASPISAQEGSLLSGDP